MAAEQYMGPIPTADEFHKYKEVQADSTNRIVTVFEQDSAHVRKTQQEGLDAAINFDKRSQWMAFSIIILGLLGTFLLAYLDKDIASIVTAAGTAILIFKGVFSKSANK